MTGQCASQQVVDSTSIPHQATRSNDSTQCTANQAVDRIEQTLVQQTKARTRTARRTTWVSSRTSRTSGASWVSGRTGCASGASSTSGASWVSGRTGRASWDGGTSGACRNSGASGARWDSRACRIGCCWASGASRDSRTCTATGTVVAIVAVVQQASQASQAKQAQCSQAQPVTSSTRCAFFLDSNRRCISRVWGCNEQVAGNNIYGHLLNARSKGFNANNRVRATGKHAIQRGFVCARTREGHIGRAVFGHNNPITSQQLLRAVHCNAGTTPNNFYTIRCAGDNTQATWGWRCRRSSCRRSLSQQRDVTSVQRTSR